MKVHTVRLTDEEHLEFVNFCDEYGYSQTGLIKSLLRKKINEEN